MGASPCSRARAAAGAALAEAPPEQVLPVDVGLRGAGPVCAASPGRSPSRAGVRVRRRAQLYLNLVCAMPDGAGVLAVGTQPQTEWSQGPSPCAPSPTPARRNPGLLPRSGGLRRRSGPGPPQEPAGVPGECRGHPLQLPPWAFPGWDGAGPLSPCRAPLAASQGPGSTGGGCCRRLLPVTMAFRCCTSGLRLGGLRPPGCHSFLPANCLALSLPAPPRSHPLLPFASNGQLCDGPSTVHPPPPPPPSGCQAGLGDARQGPAVPVHGGRSAQPGPRPEFSSRSVLHIECPISAQHGCPPGEGPDEEEDQAGQGSPCCPGEDGGGCWQRDRGWAAAGHRPQPGNATPEASG